MTELSRSDAALILSTAFCMGGTRPLIRQEDEGDRLALPSGRRGGRPLASLRLPHLNFPWTSVERLDLAAGRKCCDSCDKRLPLAAFKEDSDGGGVL